MARWIEKLQEYVFEVQHRPGKKHQNADSLSRLPEHFSINASTCMYNQLKGYTNVEMRNLQINDEPIGPVLQAKEDQLRPSQNDLGKYSYATRKLFQLWEQLTVENGFLIRLFKDADQLDIVVKQLVVPKSIQSHILEELHAGVTGGHLGQLKTLQKFKSRYYWPGHYKDVENWCNTCPSCATRKTPIPKGKGPMTSITTGSPMQLLALCN